MDGIRGWIHFRQLCNIHNYDGDIYARKISARIQVSEIHHVYPIKIFSTRFRFMLIVYYRNLYYYCIKYQHDEPDRLNLSMQILTYVRL